MNQVRGLEDASAVSALSRLEILEFYGLARLARLPKLDALIQLRRLVLGQLRGLRDWKPLLRAPALRELSLINKLDPDEDVLEELARRGTLETFDWFAPDEPISKVERVRGILNRPPSAPERPEDWLRRHS